MCFDTYYKTQFTRLLWGLHIIMRLAQSLRVWSSLNVCSLFAITVPECERLWWWQRLFIFRQNLRLPENCLERDRNSGDKRSHFVASPHAQRSTHTALSPFPWIFQAPCHIFCILQLLFSFLECQFTALDTVASFLSFGCQLNRLTPWWSLPSYIYIQTAFL